MNIVFLSLGWIFTACLFLVPTTAHGYKYYYTGITNTAKVARQTSATFTMTQHATNCKYSSDCLQLGWTILWNNDPTIAQYIEAGIGYQPARCPTATPVKLWYATPQSPGGSNVGCVALGTPVTVTITKLDGQAWATVKWQYGSTVITRSPSLPGWWNGPGIHPTKAEVYSKYDAVTPYPFTMRIQNATLYPEDYPLIQVQQTSPYLLVPGALWEDFTVRY